MGAKNLNKTTDMSANMPTRKSSKAITMKSMPRKNTTTMAKTTKNSGMTVSEAGHKGGSTTAKRYGHEFYQEIGMKGGKKGGQTTLERYGPQFYEEIGRKGGAKVRDLINEAKKARGER